MVPSSSLRDQIRSDHSIRQQGFKPIKKWCSPAGDQAGQSTLVYGGNENRIQYGIEVMGWQEFLTDTYK